MAGVARSTASEHLAKLVAAGLVKVRLDGRHRYYSLSAPAVAEALESIEGVANTLAQSCHGRSAPARAALHARCCYDHVAGWVGVRLAEAMFSLNYLEHTRDGTRLTESGRAWLSSIGVDFDDLQQSPRRLLRLCPDWSENAIHVGGSVGAAMLTGFLTRGWMRRKRRSTVLDITPHGKYMFRKTFGLDTGQMCKE